jgi:hypothetical protein
MGVACHWAALLFGTCTTSICLAWENIVVYMRYTYTLKSGAIWSHWQSLP